MLPDLTGPDPGPDPVRKRAHRGILQRRTADHGCGRGRGHRKGEVGGDAARDGEGTKWAGTSPGTVRGRSGRRANHRKRNDRCDAGWLTGGGHEVPPRQSAQWVLPGDAGCHSGDNRPKPSPTLFHFRKKLKLHGKYRGRTAATSSRRDHAHRPCRCTASDLASFARLCHTALGATPSIAAASPTAFTTRGTGASRRPPMMVPGVEKSTARPIPSSGCSLAAGRAAPTASAAASVRRSGKAEACPAGGTRRSRGAPSSALRSDRSSRPS